MADPTEQLKAVQDKIRAWKTKYEKRLDELREKEANGALSGEERKRLEILEGEKKRMDEEKAFYMRQLEGKRS